MAVPFLDVPLPEEGWQLGFPGSLTSSTQTSPTSNPMTAGTQSSPPSMSIFTPSTPAQAPITDIRSLFGQQNTLQNVGDILSGVGAGLMGHPGFLQQRVSQAAAIQQAQQRTELERYNMIPHVLDSFSKQLAGAVTPEAKNVIAGVYGDLLGRIGLKDAGSFAQDLAKNPDDIQTLVQMDPDFKRLPLTAQRYLLQHPEQILKERDNFRTQRGNELAASILETQQRGGKLNVNDALVAFPDLQYASDEWKDRIGLGSKAVLEKRAGEKPTIPANFNAAAIALGHKDFLSAPPADQQQIYKQLVEDPKDLQRQIQEQRLKNAEQAATSREQVASLREQAAARAETTAAQAQKIREMQAEQFIPRTAQQEAEAHTQLNALAARGATPYETAQRAASLGFDITGKTEGFKEKAKEAFGFGNRFTLSPQTHAARGGQLKLPKDIPAGSLPYGTSKGKKAYVAPDSKIWVSEE